MAFLEVKDISKQFHTKEGYTQALDHVSFRVEQGQVFGVIGLSGAGKSTLVRCINLLERPDSGSIVLEDHDMLGLSDRSLRAERRSIGMIFQHFNLLMQRNVLDNVCFPLEIAGVRRSEARVKAMEYLDAVGLADKAKAYPVQLSGGQQQRVAIARVLASDPKLLLCDEATSALDPQTTGAILKLLKDINEKYRITMVIITHEMRVIEELCSHVAGLEEGRIVETGQLKQVFQHPQTEAAKRLVLVRRSQDILKEAGGYANAG